MGVQVLDGVSVDGDEVAASKDVYSGRLTAELLEEKIGAAPGNLQVLLWQRL